MRSTNGTKWRWSGLSNKRRRVRAVEAKSRREWWSVLSIPIIPNSVRYVFCAPTHSHNTSCVHACVGISRAEQTDLVLLEVLPQYWWEVCGVDKASRSISKEATVPVACKKAVDRNRAQFRVAMDVLTSGMPASLLWSLDKLHAAMNSRTGHKI